MTCGVYIDAIVTMKTHVTFLVRSCFASLRQLCSIRHSVPPHALQTLIHARIGDQQNRLLQFCSRRYARHTIATTTVCAERCCPTDFLGQETRPYNSTTLGATLAQILGENQVFGCVHQCLHGASYLAKNVHMVADAVQRLK
jgi:hypothetical protein